MSKHARKSDPLQASESPKSTTIEIPLPVLRAFANIESSYFDLCIRAGQQVLDAMMEQDREDLCGPCWKRDPHRNAGRAGTTQSEVTLGGRRISIKRPRVRSVDGQEMALPSFAFATHQDPLNRHTLNAVACGISGRKYARSLDLLPEDVEERSTSKSSVSRRYVAMTTQQMTTWLTTPLGDRHFPIIMIDGIHLGDHVVLIALGFDFEGIKQVLGLREGDTENSRNCMHQNVKSVLREAWDLSDAKVAKRRLERLASSLETDHPGAAASVREGLNETLTLQRLGITGTLYKKLRSTHAIENLNGGIATYSRNVKRWRSGSMVVRWTSAAIVEAEKKFRRVQGWRDIKMLITALRDLEDKEEAVAERVA